MNIEIKFRAWVKEDSEMKGYMIPHDSPELNYSELIDTHNENGHTILMQFIGIKDKNKVDIYEGDVVKGYRPSDKYLKEKNWLGVIEYAKVRCAFVVRVKHLNGSDTFDNIVSCDTDYQVDAETLTDYQYEVIGNIYEHKNLLNGQ